MYLVALDWEKPRFLTVKFVFHCLTHPSLKNRTCP